MSLPLLDGQGNFGSMDGDNPAAMRYTEVRMDKPAAYLLADIDKETVDFQDNYDGKQQEPTVLPARFPNMLVNGAGGIAVGMATNIPPHNLGEVIDACLALIEDPDLTSEQLIEYVPGPDFPTGGIMLGRSGARKAYLEGRGSVVIRAKTRVEEIRKDRWAIVIDEIPYQVNKATMIEKIAEPVRATKIEGIAHVQDESDRSGVRVVVELKRDAPADVVMTQPYRFHPMPTNFGCYMLALTGPPRPPQASPWAWPPVGGRRLGWRASRSVRRAWECPLWYRSSPVSSTVSRMAVSRLEVSPVCRRPPGKAMSPDQGSPGRWARWIKNSSPSVIPRR